MTITGEITVGSLMIALANLTALLGIAWKFGRDYARLQAGQEKHAEKLDEIKETLGNGKPGAFVRTPTCDANHRAISIQLTEITQDARDHRDALQTGLARVADQVREDTRLALEAAVRIGNGGKAGPGAL